MSEQTSIILLGGVSGSGKTTIAERLSAQQPGLLHVKLDWYQRPREKATINPDGYMDWEDPANRDFDRLAGDIEKIRSGAGDFSIQGEPLHVEDAPHVHKVNDIDSITAVIVDGHVALCSSKLLEMADLAVFFVSTNPDRDKLRAHHSHDEYYDETYFWPGEERFILPSKESANIVIDTYQLGLENASEALRKEILKLQV